MNILQSKTWSPMLTELQHEMNQLFNRVPSVFETETPQALSALWSPQVDIEEQDNQYIFSVDIPGVDPKDIEITMDRGELTIKGKKEAHKEEKSKNYLRTERFRGTFCRTFTLPEAVNEEKIEAKDKHGVLNIIVPKTQEKSKARKIQVKSED